MTMKYDGGDIWLAAAVPPPAPEGRSFRLRDRVTLMVVDECYGSEPVVVDVEAREVE